MKTMSSFRSLFFQLLTAMNDFSVPMAFCSIQGTTEHVRGSGFIYSVENSKTANKEVLKFGVDCKFRCGSRWKVQLLYIPEGTDYKSSSAFGVHWFFILRDQTSF